MSRERNPNTPTICIDWYNTLSTSRFFEQLEDPHHPRHHLSPVIQSVLFGELKDYINPWMRGALLSEDVIEMMADKMHAEVALIQQEFVESCAAMQIIDPHVLELISELRRVGHIVAIATDNMDSFTRWTVPALGLSLYFDYIFNSHVLGVLKGDQDLEGNSIFFSLVREEVPADSQIILIDDTSDRNGVFAKSEVALLTVTTEQTLADHLKHLIKKSDSHSL